MRTRLNFFGMGLVASLFAVGCTLANPDFQFADGGVDGSGDQTAGDASDADLLASDTSGIDLVADLTTHDLVALPCQGDQTPCVLGSGEDGVCVAGKCSYCIESLAADTLCSETYDEPRVCSAGACVAGDCSDSADCASRVCYHNHCLDCAGDDECMSDPVYGPDYECRGGACLPRACMVAASQPTLGCDSDLTMSVCCSVTLLPGSLGTCQMGNCCDDADCGSDGSCIKPPGQSSVGAAGVCQTCQAPSGNIRHVRADTGSDTGNGSEACPFATITRALATLPSPAPIGTTIVVRGKLFSNELGDEAYPLSIPSNVYITTDDSFDEPPLYVVPGAQPAFRFIGKNIRIGGSSPSSQIVVDGGGVAGGVHVGVTVESNAEGTIDNFVVSNFEQASSIGVRVRGGGKLVLGAGTAIRENALGVLVEGTGAAAGQVVAEHTASLTVDAVRFEDNAVGLAASGSGWFRLLGNGSLNSISFSHNQKGIDIAQQAPPTGSVNVIDAVEISSSAGGTGLVVTTGSRLTLRRAGFFDGAISVAIEGTIADPTGIDLGRDGDLGNNTIRWNSTGSGLCVRTTNALSKPLLARGNRFGGLNCAATSGTLVHAVSKGCTSQADIGVESSGAVTLSSYFDVTSCSTGP